MYSFSVCLLRALNSSPLSSSYVASLSYVKISTFIHNMKLDVGNIKKEESITTKREAERGSGPHI